jgi:hypothetical protein
MRTLLKPVLLCILLSCILAAGASAEGRTVALVIGIDKYISQSISQLKAAVADSKAFSEALSKYAGLAEEDVKLYTCDQGEGSPRRPTKANIALALDWAARAVKPADTFIFYFAGHGISRWEKSYILPVDANTASANVAAMTALSLDDLKLMLGAVKAAHQIVIMDCCRNDPTSARGDEDNVANTNLMRDVQIVGQVGAQQAGAKSSSVLFSCSLKERAYERADGRNGVFTHYLVEGLSGKAARGGEITFDDLAYYVEARVPGYLQNEPGFPAGTKQTPWHKSEGSGRVVLARTGQRDVVVEPTPTPTGGHTTEALVTTATVSITGAPEGATVYVDGVEVGRIPMVYTVDLGPLQEKAVDVVAMQPGFKTKAARITMRRNAQADWRAELEQEQTVVLPPKDDDILVFPPLDGGGKIEPPPKSTLQDPVPAEVTDLIDELKTMMHEALAGTRDEIEVEGWPVYRGTGWTMQYPPDWQIKQALPTSVWLGDASGLSNIISALLDQAPGAVTVDQFIQTALAVLTANQPAVVLDSDRAHINGQFGVINTPGDSLLVAYRWMHPQRGKMFTLITATLLGLDMVNMQTSFMWAAVSCPEDEVGDTGDSIFIPAMLSGKGEMGGD